MTKKQAYKIIEKEYGNYDGSFYIDSLCNYAPKELINDWRRYWYQISTKKHSLVSNVFFRDHEIGILSSLARLMLLHDFIEDTYD